MNQAEVTKLISQLKTTVNPRLRLFRNQDGPLGRLKKLRKTVTALIKHERIELNYPKADEARMYAERLISDAIRNGDCHRETMDAATFWLEEKQLVHKLYKVLVPRYENYTTSFTRLLHAPRQYPGRYEKSVLELKGNPFPSLLPDRSSNKFFIHNVLLEEARKEYQVQKRREMASKIDLAEKEALKEFENRIIAGNNGNLTNSNQESSECETVNQKDQSQDFLKEKDETVTEKQEK